MCEAHGVALKTTEPGRASPAAMGQCETYMHGRLMATKRHTTAEATHIIERLQATRKVFCESPRQWNVGAMNLSFYGFGTDFERNIMLRCIKYATCPRLIHSTFMPGSPGAFEGFMLVHPSSPVALIEDLETLVDLFKMSVGVTDLGSYMQAPMLTCIERIESGVRPYGNWKALRSSGVRNCFTALQRDRDLRIAKESVSRLTGLEFTTSNMIALHHARRNVEIDQAQRLDVLRQITVHLDSLGGMMLDETEVSLQFQYLRNIQGLVNDAIHDPSRLHVLGLETSPDLIEVSNVVAFTDQIVRPAGPMLVIDLTLSA